MQNFDEALRLEKESLGSAGLAAERYAIYLESVEAKANALKLSFENLWQKAISSDLIKNFLTTMTGLVEWLTKVDFGALAFTATLIGLGFGLIKIIKIAPSVI
jgi:hypothetical protein